jgi:hypothetical protein
MIKYAALTLFVLIGLGEAFAQDFNHRDSRERRRGDHRRGFSDGTDCAREATKVAEAACADQRGRGCDRLFYELNQDSLAFVHRIATSQPHDPYNQVSQGTRYLAQRTLDCKDDRESRFDRDVERESNQWHEAEERRQRERQGQPQQSGGNQNNGLGTVPNDWD